MLTKIVALCLSLGCLSAQGNITNYVFFGQSDTLKRIDRASRVPSMMVGHGMRTGDEMLVDLCSVLYLNPNAMTHSIQASGLVAAQFLHGFYIGPTLSLNGRLLRYHIGIYHFDFRFAGTLGYHISEDRSKFVQFSYNDEGAMSLGLGLAFSF